MVRQVSLKKSPFFFFPGSSWSTGNGNISVISFQCQGTQTAPKKREPKGYHQTWGLLTFLVMKKRKLVLEVEWRSPVGNQRGSWMMHSQGQPWWIMTLEKPLKACMEFEQSSQKRWCLLNTFKSLFIITDSHELIESSRTSSLTYNVLPICPGSKASAQVYVVSTPKWPQGCWWMKQMSYTPKKMDALSERT